MTKGNSTVNAELDKHLKQLLRDVMREHPDDSKNASLTDKMKVIDRILKWEAVKGKLKDGDWASGFTEE